MSNRNESRRQALAWMVHLITASGAVVGLLALIAITEERWIPAIIWMVVATFIDSFDGTVARVLNVKGLLPGFDGATLDYIVDYFTYVLVPAFFLYQADLFPPSLALVGAAIMILSSAYQFSQGDAKTDDNFFKGFPSYWNVVAFYLFLLALNPWANLLIITVLGILVFVPIRYIYPSRTVRFQRLTLLLSLLWSLATFSLILNYPEHSPLLLYGSLLFIFYYVGTSVYLTKQATRNA